MNIDVGVNENQYVRAGDIKWVVEYYKALTFLSSGNNDMDIVFDSIVACLTDKDFRESVLHADIIKDTGWLVKCDEFPKEEQLKTLKLVMLLLDYAILMVEKYRGNPETISVYELYQCRLHDYNMLKDCLIEETILKQSKTADMLIDELKEKIKDLNEEVL